MYVGRRGWGLLPIGLKTNPLHIRECNAIFVFRKVNEKDETVL